MTAEQLELDDPDECYSGCCGCPDCACIACDPDCRGVETVLVVGGIL